MKKLAFVIPFYKINFFEDTLSALDQQTNKDFNVYIGDDKSENNPKELIKKYADCFDLQYKRFNNNLGATDLEGQWIRCINLSKDEEWICILADDDYPKANFVEEFYKNLDLLDEKKINVIKVAITSINEKGKVRGADLNHPTFDTSLNYFWRDRNGETYTSISENIFRRTAFEEKRFRGFPLAWGTPLIAWIDFSEGGEIFGLNSTQMCVRVSEINLSRIDSFKDQKHRGEFMVYEIIFTDYKSRFNSKQLFFLTKQYHSIVHYYKIRNKLPDTILKLYKNFAGLKGIAYYMIKELKWKFIK
ncbi:glycosyltransferase family 2 protein [Halpernia frigidisoli]|uniref:Glycosyl transferase family 2 n=1 Tax=Halpernia frigidisoli TaxID=1125876 RepID=A0A1I3GM46_9FLAO|nr:glycosyltransferase [Halpernia frigidisoli]SFI24519.1 Glycosyl transferase family 2 [Halpernia frigidisoli]